MRKSSLSRRSPMKRGGRVRPVNRKRRKSEFARCYHSKARVEWVKSLPCVFCAHRGCSENAHVWGRSGMGRKGPYTEIVPLCGPWSGLTSEGPLNHPGCHRLFDRHEWPLNNPEVREFIRGKAKHIEYAWQLHASERSERVPPNPMSGRRQQGAA